MVNHEGKANRRFQRAVQVRKHAPESLPEEHQGSAVGPRHLSPRMQDIHGQFSGLTSLFNQAILTR